MPSTQQQLQAAPPQTVDQQLLASPPPWGQETEETIQHILEREVSARLYLDLMGRSGKLLSREQQLAHLLVAGYKLREAATSLGMGHQTAAVVSRSPLFRAYYNELCVQRANRAVDIGARMEALAPLALDVLQEFMLNAEHDSKERRIIAQDLLDRLGYSVKDGNLTLNIGDGAAVQLNVDRLTPDERVSLINKRISESRRANVQRPGK